MTVNRSLITNPLQIGTLLAVCLLPLAACNNASEQAAVGSTAAPNSASANASAAAPAALPANASAQQIGDAVAAVYLRAMSETAAMLAEKPAVDQVSARIGEAKRRWIEEMVELGRRVEKLDKADQARVQTIVNTMYRNLQKDPAMSADWKAFNTAINAYINSDPEFFRELKPLNILTQYAFFDLLRQQTPKEAERLGLASTAG